MAWSRSSFCWEIKCNGHRQPLGNRPTVAQVPPLVFRSPPLGFGQPFKEQNEREQKTGNPFLMEKAELALKRNTAVRLAIVAALVGLLILVAK